MYCSVCGEVVQRDQSICNFCGHLLDDDDDKENYQQQGDNTNITSISPNFSKQGKEKSVSSFHSSQTHSNEPSSQTRKSENREDKTNFDNTGHTSGQPPADSRGRNSSYERNNTNTLNFAAPVEFQSFPDSPLYTDVPELEFLADDFEGGILQAVKLTLFDPEKAAPVFLSRISPSIAILILTNLFAHLIFITVEQRNLILGRTATFPIFDFTFTSSQVLVYWACLSILLFVFLHSSFPVDSVSRSSIGLWFRVTSYLMVINTTQLLLLSILKLTFFTLSFYSFASLTILNFQYSMYEIIINIVFNLVCGLVAYKLLKKGFKFDKGASILGMFLVCLPQFTFLRALTLLFFGGTI